MNKHIYLCTSALLGATPFLWPQVLWPLLLVFLVPLFYVALRTNLLFFDGFLWGIVFFSVHSFGLLVLICQHGFGAIRFILPLLYVVYCSVYSGVWFFCAKRLQQLLAAVITQTSATLVSWSAITFTYFWVIDRFLFWLFGALEGNTLAHPVIPFVATQWGIRALQLFGKDLLVLLLIGMQALVALQLLQQRVFGVVTTACCIALPLFLLQEAPSAAPPAWLSTVAAIYPPPDKALPTTQKLHIISEQLRICTKKNPNVQCIIMPESTLSVPLNQFQDYISSWYQQDIPPSLSIIVGAHRKEGAHMYNTCYWINSGRIRQHYDKRKPLFFTEKVPEYWAFSTAIRSLFLHNSILFSDGVVEPTRFTIGADCQLTPIICSELFLAQQHEPMQESALVALVNDSWFSMRYIQQLLELCARLKAVVWHKDIVYVSHTRALWIGKNGAILNL